MHETMILESQLPLKNHTGNRFSHACVWMRVQAWVSACSMTSALLRKRETMSAYLFVFEREREQERQGERASERKTAEFR